MRCLRMNRAMGERIAENEQFRAFLSGSERAFCAESHCFCTERPAQTAPFARLGLSDWLKPRYLRAIYAERPAQPRRLRTSCAFAGRFPVAFALRFRRLSCSLAHFPSSAGAVEAGDGA